MKGRLLIGLILIVLAGCATAPAYNPYLVPKSQVQSQVKSIALSPVRFPPVVEKAQGAKEKIELLITAKLTQAGYSVVPSKEFGGVWDRFVEQVGGIFDPVTGKADEGKIKVVREHTRREMTNRFKINAFLYPTVQVIGVPLKGSRAVWDGISESIMADGWYRSFEGGATQALSLRILLEDENGVDLYLKRGGIQLIAKTVKGRFVNIQASEILASEEKIAGAIHIALKEFIQNTETPGNPPKPTN